MGPEKGMIHCVLSLYHVMLPWDCSGCRVVVMIQVLPQLFPCLHFYVAMDAL